MNSFLEDDIIISKLNYCCKVSNEISMSVHKNRSSHGIVLFLKGQSEFRFSDGSILNIKAGEIIYLPKYSSYSSMDSDGAECIAINFDILENEKIFPYFHVNIRYGEKYQCQFYKFLQLWNRQRTGYLSGCLAVLYEIIYDIQNDMKREYKSTSQVQLIEKAVYYINDNIRDVSLTVEEIAEKLNITSVYLRYLFREVNGISPKEYMIRKRIDMAKAMISSCDIKLNLVPYECGFKDYCHFSRVFKKKVGVSPLNYSKKQ